VLLLAFFKFFKILVFVFGQIVRTTIHIQLNSANPLLDNIFNTTLDDIHIAEKRVIWTLLSQKDVTAQC